MRARVCVLLRAGLGALVLHTLVRLHDDLERHWHAVTQVDVDAHSARTTACAQPGPLEGRAGDWHASLNVPTLGGCEPAVQLDGTTLAAQDERRLHVGRRAAS